MVGGVAFVASSVRDVEFPNHRDGEQYQNNDGAHAVIPALMNGKLSVEQENPEDLLTSMGSSPP